MIKTRPVRSECLQNLPHVSTIKDDIPLQIISQPSRPIVIEDESANNEKKSEIPKPPNAFMIFATEWRKKLVVEHPSKYFSFEISVIHLTVHKSWHIVFSD